MISRLMAARIHYIQTASFSYLTHSWLPKRAVHPITSTSINTFLIRLRSAQSPRLSSTMSRTYESALARLAELQSNRAITSLFEPPALPTPTSSTGASASSKKDLNALAIPEMLAWLQRAGISQADLLASRLRCIHVAGTKGKGSVCAYLTALLTHGEGSGVTAGKVGTYTSPHLVSVRERIAIDGVPISKALFARYFFEVWDACTEAARQAAANSRKTKNHNRGVDGEGEEEPVISEAELQGPSTKPFFFRFLTIVALRAFLGEGVRSAVIECGIGGEYDSTNILPAETVTVSVVAQLGIDHVAMLGSTLSEIAWHKAGVCKEGRKCFTRRLRARGGEEEEEKEETMRVLRQRATGKGATLVEVEDADVENWGGVPATEMEAGSLEGDFQKSNQALAVYAAREHLRVLASEVSSSSDNGGIQEAITVKEGERLEDIPASFTTALRHARLRGRCETHEDASAPITWLIDGAHTAESLAEVARWFASKTRAPPEETILLFNQQDRDAAKLVDGLMRAIQFQSQSHNKITTQEEEEKEKEKVKVPDEKKGRIFSHAIFTRNDLEPREAAREPEQRDLTVQKAAAEALREVAPETSTSVLDNVADAVAEVRAQALANARLERRVTVLATGSLYLVSALLRTLEPDAED